ncbi:MAG: protein kinase domain-containing protein [Ruminococcus sp.]
MGKYCLLDELGQGGSGRVFLAADIRLRKKWAVKIFHDAAKGSDEIQILKELDHPMIPRIVEYLDEDGVSGIVMDYMDGADLGTLGRKERIFSAEQILEFGIALCDVLIYLHTRKPPIIYGDLKPQNLILTVEGRLKIVDFGCAGREGKKQFAGTEGYAPPEQYRGEGGKTADIYSLGVTLEVAGRGRIPAALKRIVKKCRRKNPAKRYQSAEQVLKEFLLCREKIRAKKKRPRLLLGGGAVLTGLLAVNILVSAGKEAACLEAVREDRFYDAAVLFPEREELYTLMLRKGMESGKTEETILQIKGMQKLYPAETEHHYGIRLLIARLYLQGNPMDKDFPPDYSQAEVWYASVSEEEYPDVKWERELLSILTESGEQADWKQRADTLKKLYQTLKKTGDLFPENMPLELLASVWLTNRYYFETAGENPLQRCIELLEECLASGENESDSGGERLLSRCVMLSQAFYLKGMYEKDEDSLKKCLEVYEEIKKQAISETLYCEILHKTAYIYEATGKYDFAAEYYEQVLKLNPRDVQVYCEYALMEMADRGDFEKAGELFRAAGKVKGAGENRNYRILEERLEESGI